MGLFDWVHLTTGRTLCYLRYFCLEKEEFFQTIFALDDNGPHCGASDQLVWHMHTAESTLVVSLRGYQKSESSEHIESLARKSCLWHRGARRLTLVASWQALAAH